MFVGIAWHMIFALLRSVAALVTAGQVAALMSTGAAANGPARPIVSEAAFAEIIAILNERPDTPPQLLAERAAMIGATPAGKQAALQACRLARHDMLFRLYRSKPAPDLGPNRSAFDVTETRLPLLLGARAGTPLFVRTDVMAVNLDGSPRAYHPSDIWAANCTPQAASTVGAAAVTPAAPPAGTPCALNLLCYAGVRFFVDGSRPVRCADRAEYQKHWDEMWPLIESGRAVSVPESYWARDPQRSTDGRYGFFHPEKSLTVLFKNTIIPRDSRGGPCRRDVATARYQGYFVGKTSLTGSERADEPEGRSSAPLVTEKQCSPLPYVNAETLPALVIPKGGFAGAAVGDLVVAYRKDRAGTARWVYAIVGDEGPNDKFGEGSLALNAALRGHPPGQRWDNYRELVRDTHIGERGAGKEDIGVMIFRGSSRRAAGDLSRRNVARVAERLFRRFGDGSLEAARSRFLACLDALTP
jgi:hypothetical protein